MALYELRYLEVCDDDSWLCLLWYQSLGLRIFVISVAFLSAESEFIVAIFNFHALRCRAWMYFSHTWMCYVAFVDNYAGGKTSGSPVTLLCNCVATRHWIRKNHWLWEQTLNLSIQNCKHMFWIYYSYQLYGTYYSFKSPANPVYMWNLILVLLALCWRYSNVTKIGSHSRLLTHCMYYVRFNSHCCAGDADRRRWCLFVVILLAAVISRNRSSLYLLHNRNCLSGFVH